MAATTTMSFPLIIILSSLLVFLLPSSSHSSTLPLLPTLGPSTTLSSLTSLDAARLAYLSSLATAGRSFVPIASGQHLIQTPIYVVRAKFGTPPQSLLVAVDTSSDAAWIPCTSCLGCPPSSPSFSPSLSTSFGPFPCNSLACFALPTHDCSTAPDISTACAYNFTYGSSLVAAELVHDSISLASDVVAYYNFGCVKRVTGTSAPPQGLLGFGRGPVSFLSQTKPLYNGVFSYCLPSFRSSNFSGTLRLGPAGQPVNIKTTPLLSNPRRSSLYYVEMTGVRVGRQLVAIPPAALAFDRATGAGTVIDSGTMVTRLVAPAYVAVRDEFRRRVRPRGSVVSSLGGFDTCYNGAIMAPAVMLMFRGMNVTLPAENVMIHSTAGSISCLAMAAAPDNVNSVLNVIASMQQQNHRVLFDVANGRVGFARELCTSA